MSYDIYLYEKQFLKRALEQKLGDWTNSDPISAEKLRIVVEFLKAKGYEPQDDTEFEHPNSEWGLQVSIFEGEVAFSIPYADDSLSAIEIASTDALQAAKDADLGFYDPQTGEAIT